MHLTAVNPNWPKLPRRQWLARALVAPLLAGRYVQAQTSKNEGVKPTSKALQARLLEFPRDLGSHPDFALEWWYLTGQVQAVQREFGFQLTFFRARNSATQAMSSNFAAKHLIFAHAAVTDVTGQRLLHDQRIARTSGTGQVNLASASTTDSDVQLGDWSLNHDGAIYIAQAGAQDFAFKLNLHETQPLLLQGERGLSRKGPQARQASFYYSLPQLQVSGQISVDRQTLPVQGRAWLDHEWSQAMLHPDAVGWDWIGMNLLDGSALTAFRLRTQAGETLWAGGSFRTAGQVEAEIFGSNDVVFTPLRNWKSANSGASYPVQWSIQIKRTKPYSGQPRTERFTTQTVIDNQELDSRASTGAIYWEGLSNIFGADGRLLGRGYLEMTGYASPLLLPG